MSDVADRWVAELRAAIGEDPTILAAFVRDEPGVAAWLELAARDPVAAHRRIVDAFAAWNERAGREAIADARDDERRRAPNTLASRPRGRRPATVAREQDLAAAFDELGDNDSEGDVEKWIARQPTEVRDRWASVKPSTFRNLCSAARSRHRSGVESSPPALAVSNSRRR